ncbi:hypothetical protein N864_15310 [Intrasporangium chromatireducens Q5-1]|uniref:Uncharacterized protein n=1 Tax=Intrasporangium chromatireducens Q5-1 TaxID=584657 RepID=W9GDC1_9MICO|nr:alkaline phosphatase PhoX [Intrasporangium chromatireducens]EWT04206.1 hypothetical protein N864_15310 [Intrasporangium chromatireducens Q5-1]
MKRSTVAALAATTTCLGLVATGTAVAAPAQTGPSTTTSPYVQTVRPGVVTKSVLTVGDRVGDYRLAGTPDGLGAYDNGDGTFTLVMNHEFGATSGVVRDHGAAGAFISKWTVEKGSLRVRSGEDLVQQVKSWNGTAWENITTAFNRMCSADLADVSAFYDAATGKGTQTRIFLNGEEAGSEGRALAHVVDGPDAGTSYILPWLGKASWENVVAMPNTGDKTVVVGLDDSGGGQVYVYVGDKKSTGNDVERAGLTGGTLYGLAIDGVAAENDATTVGSGAGFRLIEIPAAAGLSGAQLEAKSKELGVSALARPEDGAWDPTNPGGFYFATTASFTGISRLWHLDFADAADVTAGGRATIAVASPAYDATKPQAEQEGPRMMDNITVNDRGQVLMQEDPGGNDYLAGVFQYDPTTGGAARIARFDAKRFAPGAANFITRDEESSGIIPVPFLGAGKYLFTAQVHAKTGDPETVEQGQLALLSVPPGQPVR